MQPEVTGMQPGIAAVQAEVQQLKQANTALNQQLAVSELAGPPSPHPRSPLKQVPLPSQTTATTGKNAQSEPRATKPPAEHKTPDEEHLQHKLLQASCPQTNDTVAQTCLKNLHCTRN